MPASAFLRDDVHAVILGEDLVLLDVAADSYVCLPAIHGRLLLGSGRERLTCADPDLLADLHGAGLLQRAAGEVRAALPAPPTRSAVPADIPLPQRGDLGPMIGSLGDVLARYRRRRFADILATARRARSSAPRHSADLEAAVRRFHIWAPYAPVPAKCLLRSFMLLRLLRRRGLDALWVFGVRTWPFHAHCWLQVEDVALDDAAERVAAYTPILVV